MLVRIGTDNSQATGERSQYHSLPASTSSAMQPIRGNPAGRSAAEPLTINRDMPPHLERSTSNKSSPTILYEDKGKEQARTPDNDVGNNDIQSIITNELEYQIVWELHRITNEERQRVIIEAATGVVKGSYEASKMLYDPTSELCKKIMINAVRNIAQTYDNLRRKKAPGQGTPMDHLVPKYKDTYSLGDLYLHQYESASEPQNCPYKASYSALGCRLLITRSCT
jgi:hypothetical protein